MADLARDVRPAAVHLAIQHDAATDPCPDGEPHYVLHAARRAPPPLPEDGAIGVVVERRGQTQCLSEPVAQREVGPSEVRRQEDDAGRRVERARRADPDARDLLAARGANRSAGELGDAIDHRVRPLLGDGRLRDEAQHLGPVLSHGPRDDVGATDVDPHYVAHAPPRLTPPPPPPPPPVRARRRPRSPPAPARRPHPACSGGGATGTPAARAGSTGGTAAL